MHKLSTKMAKFAKIIQENNENFLIKKFIRFFKRKVANREKKRFSFVLLKPETGRKRQIREHCFVLGCPILGDKKYFKKLDQNKNIDSNKLFLHAYKLKIIKKDGIKEEFTAPLPDHIRKFCYLYKIPINETFINKFVISNILKGAKELKN